MHSLQGKYVLCSRPESFRTGYVKAADNNAILVQFDQMNAPDKAWSFPAELVCIEEVIHDSEDDLKTWGFFDTREELNAYLKWLDGPGDSKARVVKLVPKP